MIFQLLGCGTSTGVPLPGCQCTVCTSPDPRNKRFRCSGVIKLPNGRRILIDASTDLRMQALTYDLRRVDAVIFTHAHADHILGVEDLRGFNFVQKEKIPCYASAATLKELRRFYSYIFSPNHDYEGGGLAQLTLHEIEPLKAINLCGVEILPFTVMHGRLSVLGFRINNFAYATDCNAIPDESFTALAGVKTLVIDGQRYEPHPTHFTIPEACAAAQKIGAEKTYLTHTAHTIDYDVVNPKLPAGIELAYDGLEFEI